MCRAGCRDWRLEQAAACGRESVGPSEHSAISLPLQVEGEEWDQEPWVHEKHGGVRGGLGQGRESAEREG